MVRPCVGSGGAAPPDFVIAYQGRERSKGSVKPNAQHQITLRLDHDVIERFRVTGPGRQARINKVLKRVE